MRDTSVCCIEAATAISTWCTPHAGQAAELTHDCMRLLVSMCMPSWHTCTAMSIQPTAFANCLPQVGYDAGLQPTERLRTRAAAAAAAQAALGPAGRSKR
jgi:hypothetical protein